MLSEFSAVQEIKLSEMFEGNISTRAAVSLIQKRIDPTANKVVLDFSDIKFISRSFTHELLRFIDAYSSRIVMEHTNTDIKSMVKIVKKAKHTTQKSEDPPLINLSDSASAF